VASPYFEVATLVYVVVAVVIFVSPRPNVVLTDFVGTTHA
jgi:hypothetical protein